MTEVIERVAKAISEKSQVLAYGRVLTPWRDPSMADTYIENRLDEARAAIEAIPEPAGNTDLQYPFGATLDEMDVESFFNMRDWLKQAVEAKGAKMVGGGVGLGQADIDVDLEGCRYNISIRPLPHSP